VRKPNAILTVGSTNHSELGTAKETNPMPMHYGHKKEMKGMKGKKEEMAEMKKAKAKKKKKK
jgi:hypothetical protein